MKYYLKVQMPGEPWRSFRPCQDQGVDPAHEAQGNVTEMEVKTTNDVFTPFFRFFLAT